MKYFLLHVCLILCLPTVCSVKAQVKTGPVLDDFGPVYPIEDADLLPDSDRLYKVIFDVYTDERKSDRMNPLIHTVARFLNMHGRYGVAEENMKLVLVLHGTATKNALSDNAYKKMAKKSMIAREKNRKYRVRVRNRCEQCGRPRGYMRRFGLCRICFREEALKGNIPGVVKSSW